MLLMQAGDFLTDVLSVVSVLLVVRLTGHDSAALHSLLIGTQNYFC